MRQKESRHCFVAYHPDLNRASSSFDQRHVLNFGYVWDVPLFKNPGLANRVLGGWQYSGITTFSTGSPFSVLFNTDNAGVGNGLGSAAYADIVGDAKAGVSQAGGLAGFGPLFYNPAAFASPQGLTFGDSGRNRLRNPARINFDMAVFKHITIKESTAIEFRAEAFNVFNHTEWGAIAGDPGSGAGNNSSGTNQVSGFADGDLGSGVFRPQFCAISPYPAIGPEVSILATSVIRELSFFQSRPLLGSGLVLRM
jgi:hypothetical protein